MNQGWKYKDPTQNKINALNHSSCINRRINFIQVFNEPKFDLRLFPECHTDLRFNISIQGLSGRA